MVWLEEYIFLPFLESSNEAMCLPHKFFYRPSVGMYKRNQSTESNQTYKIGSSRPVLILYIFLDGAVCQLLSSNGLVNYPES